MKTTTTVRVSRSTHELLGELAQRSGETVTGTLDRAVNLLQQEIIGKDLAGALSSDEVEWLDADAG